MEKHLIYYNNGTMETTDSVNITLIHMVEIGVIKFIFNMKSNEAIVRTEDGLHKSIKITDVSGLN